MTRQAITDLPKLELQLGHWASSSYVCIFCPYYPHLPLSYGKRMMFTTLSPFSRRTPTNLIESLSKWGGMKLCKRNYACHSLYLSLICCSLLRCLFGLKYWYLKSPLLVEFFHPLLFSCHRTIIFSLAPLQLLLCIADLLRLVLLPIVPATCNLFLWITVEAFYFIVSTAWSLEIHHRHKILFSLCFCRIHDFTMAAPPDNIHAVLLHVGKWANPQNSIQAASPISLYMVFPRVFIISSSPMSSSIFNPILRN